VTLRDVTADASISDAFRHALQRQMANFPASCAPEWATVAQEWRRHRWRPLGATGGDIANDQPLQPGFPAIPADTEKTR
jgi:hypothetical protein